jgi:hypothetical protein
MARLAWLVLAAQLAAGGASAQTLHELTAKGLVWRMKPNGADIAQIYPPKAQREEKAGWAVAECLTLETGDLKDCKLLGEAPANYGFGEAALKLTPKFKIDAKKSDPGILKDGVIAIPIILLTPVRSPVPLRDYLAGDPSTLLTIAPGGRGAPCPTEAAPTQKCVSHPFTWAQRPTIVETAALVRSVGDSASATAVLCDIGGDMRLSHCAQFGPANAAEIKAMAGLTPLFTAPAEADDKTSTRNGKILVQFNWPALRHAVETSALTRARP